MSRLSDQLHRLRSLTKEDAANPREMTAPDEGELLRMVLREVDEVFLTRRISLTRTDGRKAEIVAAGRRLRRLVVADQFGISDEAAPDLDKLAILFAKALSSFLREQRTLVFGMGPSDEKREPTEAGCTAEAIAKAAGLGALGQPVAARPVPEGPLASFSRDVSGSALVWVRVDADGDPIDGGGPEEDRAELADLDPAHGAPLAGKRPAPDCVFLGQGDPESPVLLQARKDGERLVAVVMQGDRKRIAEAWRRFIAG